MSTNINQDSIAMKSFKKCCIFKYRIRWFNSKAVGLILLWTILISASTWYHFQEDYTLLSRLINEKNIPWISTLVVSLSFIVSAPVLGWLADTKLGLYKVFKIGFVFLFMASVLSSILLLVVENLPASSIVATVAIGVMAPLTYIFSSTGAAACLITALQLGMDQMPDASAVNITSYIVWFVFCIFAGIWIKDVSFILLFKDCLNNESTIIFNYVDQLLVYNINCTIFKQPLSLFPVVFMTVVLCSDSLLAKKWLIIEPKSTQSLKLIFRVLKFAAKHKAPVNRSAFTYWEEDIPSRIDLGKSKYGGPFTTEQVENVKTLFKLTTISLPVLIVLLSIPDIYQFGGEVYSRSVCDTSWWCYFINNNILCVIIGTVVYEFVIYPLVKNRLPKSLVCIGIFSFIIIFINILSLSLSVAKHFDSTLETYIWRYNLVGVLVGFLKMFGTSVVLQFICAQSPYSVRTLVTGCVPLIFILPVVVVALLQMLLNSTVPRQYYLISLYSFTSGLSIVGFVLYCLFARWYKGRVRDDIYSPHRLVEEVYDRYLSHQTPHNYNAI